MDKYEVIGTLGEGSFGRVYKAKQLSNGSFVALKVISKRGRSARELKGFRRECEIQRNLHHPNIIQMLDSFETENEIVVITEFANNELTAVLGKVGYFPEERVRQIVWDLVSALYYLHSNRVLHRDLKPQNILLDIKNRAKLCDFGFARNMSTGTHVLTSIKGTPLYMAPELIDEQPYDYNADLWSLGCIIYELLMGTPPFCTASILHLIRLIRHEQIQWPTFLSDNCISFLKGLLQKNPSKRMTWDEILNHPFIKGHILISDSATVMPLTRMLSPNTLQTKEQQRKDSIKVKQNRASCSKITECNVVNKSNTPKPSEASHNSNTSGKVNKSNSQDVTNNNVLVRLSCSSSDNKNNSKEFREPSSIVLNVSVAQDDQNENCKSFKNTGIVEENGKNTYVKPFNFIEDNQPIETEEWIVFLQRSIQEVMNGELASLIQTSQTNVLISPLRNPNASSKVLSFVARLFSIPFVVKNISKDYLSQIKKGFLEIKLVPNLVYSSKLLVRKYCEDSPFNSTSPVNSPLPHSLEIYRDPSDLSEEDFKALEHIYLLICHLVHLDDTFLLQFCDAVVVLTVFKLMKYLLLLTSKHELCIVSDVLAILTHLLRKFPENADVVEKILSTNDNEFKQINFVDLLRHSNAQIRERTCFFLLFLCKGSQEHTISAIWGSMLKETLEALMYDSMENVRNAAESTVNEIKIKNYYDNVMANIN